MLTYKIKKFKSSKKSSPPPLGKKESKIECFNRHFARCWFRVGEQVVWKKPRRNKKRGTIVHIEDDVSKVQWTEGATVPKYILVAVHKVDKDGVISVENEWASESRLMQGT